jgi:hypothetical protein
VLSSSEAADERRNSLCEIVEPADDECTNDLHAAAELADEFALERSSKVSNHVS